MNIQYMFYKQWGAINESSCWELGGDDELPILTQPTDVKFCHGTPRVLKTL